MTNALHNQYKNTLNEINKLVVGEKIRVPTTIAKALLLNNQTAIVGGKVWGLNIKKLGLGVCSVELNTSTGKPITLMGKS